MLQDPPEESIVDDTIAEAWEGYIDAMFKAGSGEVVEAYKLLTSLYHSPDPAVSRLSIMEAARISQVLTLEEMRSCSEGGDPALRELVEQTVLEYAQQRDGDRD